MTLKIITAALLATLIAAPASAGPLGNAWHRQQTSIGKGLINGKLTPREVIGLEAREAAIKHQWQHMKSTGGGLNFGEKVYLGTQLAGARGAIYYHKHN